MVQIERISGHYSSSVRIQAYDHLAPEQVDACLNLIQHVSDVDGVRPISEHVMLHLRHGGDDHDSHFLATDSHGALVGYLHLDATDMVAGASAELAVAPTARRRGVGSALVARAMESYPGKYFRLWAHGEDHGAHGLALSLGFTQVRTLLQMRRSLYADLPDAPFPSDVTVRSFVPGIDNEAMLELNNRAFAEHPDQGQWTLADLSTRLAESWFTPQGFLIAESNGQMVGFHWTKVHGELRHAHGDKSTHTHQAMGEVYVLGVDPQWRGSGLGRALTVAGLRYLGSLGLDEVMLYVESDNHAARSLYSALGFTKWDSDVLYRRTTP